MPREILNDGLAQSHACSSHFAESTSPRRDWISWRVLAIRCFFGAVAEKGKQRPSRPGRLAESVCPSLALRRSPRSPALERSQSKALSRTISWLHLCRTRLRGNEARRVDRPRPATGPSHRAARMGETRRPANSLILPFCQIPELKREPERPNGFIGPRSRQRPAFRHIPAGARSSCSGATSALRGARSPLATQAACSRWKPDFAPGAAGDGN
jgi:hypothetical protein